MKSIGKNVLIVVKKGDRGTHKDDDGDKNCDECGNCFVRKYEIYITNPKATSSEDVMVQITDANCTDVLGDGTVSYDHESQTLTLNGYDNNDNFFNVGDKMVLMLNTMDNDQNLTIEIKGTNKIGHNGAIGIGIAGYKCVTFMGDGTLELIGAGPILMTEPDGKIIFYSGTVSIKTAGEISGIACGITSDHIELISGNLTIESSSIGIRGTNSNSTFTIKGGNFQATFEVGKLFLYPKFIDEDNFVYVNLDINLLGYVGKYSFIASENRKPVITDIINPLSDCEEYNSENKEKYCFVKLECLCKFEHVERVMATCDTSGKAEYWYCSVCDSYYSDSVCQSVIENIEEYGIENPLGHTFGEWIAEACHH